MDPDTTSTTSEEDQDCSEGCERCCRRVQQLEKQLRQLQEKLEYSQLQNASLSSEHSQLQHELREAVFKSRSRITVSSPPPLPNEVLRYIFMSATAFDGLAFAHWDDLAETNWNISSSARRTIPLVCRQWHSIGSEFLFEHIVICRVPQLRALLKTLRELSASGRDQMMRRVRGIEFVMREEPDEATVYKELSIGLLGSLPERQLRKFGVDCGECNGVKTDSIAEIYVEMLRKTGSHLEILHLPCVALPKLTSLPQLAPTSAGRALFTTLVATDFRLHTLSLMGGRWNQCNNSAYTGNGGAFLTALSHSTPSIRTLFLNCTFFEESKQERFMEFLDGAINVDTVHFIPNHDTKANHPCIRSVLERIPNLRRLFISPRVEASGITKWPKRFSHPLLEEIHICTTKRATMKIVDFLEFLMDQLESSNYPKLKAIVIRGSFKDGCLDADSQLPPKTKRLWKEMIERLGEQKVTMINSSGKPIHFWNERYGLPSGMNKLDGDSSSDSPRKGDDEWYEMSGEDTGSSVGSECVSDDSDDQPYRYVWQPDIRRFHSDSEEDE